MAQRTGYNISKEAAPGFINRAANPTPVRSVSTGTMTPASETGRGRFGARNTTTASAMTPASETGAGRYNARNPQNADVISVQKATPEQIAAAQAAGDAYMAKQDAAAGGGGGESGGESGGGKREQPCPFCEGEVLPKQQGRLFFAISGFIQRAFKIRIPTEFLQLLQEIFPVSKTAIRKTPDTCKACEGKLVIEDPGDERERFAAASGIASGLVDAITRAENKLAPACGNRYTVIQGCDLLEVGLGINDAPGYRVDKEKSIRAGGLIDPGDTNPKKGGPQIPQGRKANHVQGINSLATPGGHYFIKCANKFSVLAGAQGIDITTGGPFTINAGVTRITGPELTIGTQTGRLVLEGEVVNIGGKSIEVAPSDGHFFVKGTISNTGNVMVGGHAHMESASMVKAETVGRNEPSKSASPSDLYSGPAFWGGLAMEAIPATVKDLLGLVTNRAANPEEIKNLVSPRFFEDLRDKMMNIAYHLRPVEFVPTGFALVTYGSSAGLHPIFNFPHCHAMPNMIHNHETRIPDFDTTAESAEQLRGKQAGVASSAPLYKSSANSSNILTTIFSAIAVVFVPVWKGIQGLAGPYAK